jgi:uncharacterized protein (TIGR02246 family)
MRYTILLFILFGTFFSGTAQRTTNDSIVIGKQVDAFFTSWNKHDFSDMKNYVADTSDFVNIVGMHWKGREDIQYAHQTMHQQFFKDKPLRKLSVQIRFLTNDVAIAHVLMHQDGSFIAPDGSKRGDTDALATFVFIKKGDTWLVTAVENVVVDQAAKPFDPVTIRNNQSNEKK